jgi:hypothetical protein
MTGISRFRFPLIRPTGIREAIRHCSLRFMHPSDEREVGRPGPGIEGRNNTQLRHPS